MKNMPAATARTAVSTTTLLALVAILPAACSDALGPTGSVGEVSFHYDGVESGSFTARGARSPDWGTHGAGLWHDSPAVIRVYSIAFNRQGLADQFVVHAYGSKAGTYAFDEEAGPGTAHAELALDVRKDQNPARAIYVLTSGTVTFEPLEDGRIRGRFEGTARQLHGTDTIHIRDGHFDVPNNLDPPVENRLRASRGSLLPQGGHDEGGLPRRTLSRRDRRSGRWRDGCGSRRKRPCPATPPPPYRVAGASAPPPPRPRPGGPRS